ncbi:MAG: aminoglycoside phosphotransferase family protein [Micromonosporaceae bacterium]
MTPSATIPSSPVRSPLPGTSPDLPDTVGRHESGREWLAGLPALIAEVRDRWALRLGQPYGGGSCAWVAPVTLADGGTAVLKIAWPHRESAGEAEALRRWDGQGAVRLLRHDPVRHAMLLQRCQPGGKLADAELPARERLLVGAELLATLWRAPAPDVRGLDCPVPGGCGLGGPVVGGFERLADVAAEWAELTGERIRRHRPAYDPGLVALGVRLLRELPASATREVILHGDFNPGNVLDAGPDGWLVIDAKPMVGDPAYDPWPLLEQVDDVFRQPYRVLAERTRLLADALGEDPRRIAAWAVARRVESALWYLGVGYPPGGTEKMAQLRTLARLAEL